MINGMSKDYCAVCKIATSKFDGNVSYHRFPENPARKELWLGLIRDVYPKFSLKRSSKICCGHFHSKDVYGVERRVIHRCAKPTIFKDRCRPIQVKEEFVRDITDPDPLDLHIPAKPKQQLCDLNQVSETEARAALADGVTITSPTLFPLLKRRRLINDFSLSDMEDTELSKLYYTCSQEYVKSLKGTIASLMSKINRLNEQIRAQPEK